MIELINVFSGYNRKHILHNLSLKLPSGRLVAVIGPNGSGKSTLLKTIVGILPPSSGMVRIDNQNVFAMSRQDIAKKIAYLPQGRNTPDMTVGQMVLHGRFPHLNYPRRYGKTDYAVAKQAMEQMGIANLAESPIFSLSGGMRQKTYIAMAIAQDTEYILLDEPTTYLDISGQVELMKILRTLTDSGKSIVTVMHDLPLAFNFADEIVIVRDGSIAACSTPVALFESEDLSDIFGIEMKFSSTEGQYYYKYSFTNA